MKHVDLSSLSTNPEEKDVLKELSNKINAFLKVQQQKIAEHEKEHNQWLEKVNFLGIDDVSVVLSPRELAYAEMWYAYARREAAKITGYYRSIYKYFEAVAVQGRADMYVKVKLKQFHQHITNSTDAYNVSKKAEGLLLEHASEYDGDYQRWRGITESYESMINAVKDMFKEAEYTFRRDPNNGRGS